MEEKVFKSNKKNKKAKKKKLAVQIYIPNHIMFCDIIKQLKKIPYSYDLFLETTNRNKIEKVLLENKYKGNYRISVEKSKKNGMISFLSQMKKDYQNYEYILHLTIEEKENSYDKILQEQAVHSLIGTDENIKNAFHLLETEKKLGIIYPTMYNEQRKEIDFDKVQLLLEKINMKKEELDEDSQNFSKKIFLLKTKCIQPIFKILKKEEIKNDNNMSITEETIETIMSIICKKSGFYSLKLALSKEFDIKSYEANSYVYRLYIKKLQEKIKKLENEKNTIYGENVKLQNEVAKILNSKSWKITRPLREVSRIKNKIHPRRDTTGMEITVIRNQEKKEYFIYESEYQENIDYSEYKTDIKPIAFYLPQYHTFKENDEWWGKGFMEWKNTKKAKPRFDGHYQPRVPHKDIGYYTLDKEETIRKQVELAKQHGIYGFAFYYYWFSGKRLMEKPLDIFLNSKIDYPFCLYWANENWTRRWDGLEKEVLIKQEYGKEEYKQFIEDIKKYIMDPRYIKIDNKPVIMVYRPSIIPNFKELVENWKEYAKKIGVGEIYVIATTDINQPVPDYIDAVDAENDFAPHGLGTFDKEATFIDTPYVFNYKKIIEDSLHQYRTNLPVKPFYFSCTMGWDNSARKSSEYAIYYNYSIKYLYDWLRIIIEETRRRNKPEERYIFINAWNEWAEGTYLEPDEKYGYANINTISKAIFDLPFRTKK